ncbi:uncharacterized protein LOC134770682 [Penaeus indicus]|uniref:uncharacterized protein LOC134770682 n=1 Tax=Penaeus indicus TaxID=29960 RepID=UPI00300CD97C
MKLLVISAVLVATTSAALQGYGLPSPSGPVGGNGHSPAGTVHSTGAVLSSNAGHSTAASSVSGSLAGANHGFNSAEAGQTITGVHSASGNEFTSSGTGNQGSASLTTGLGVSNAGLNFGISPSGESFETPCKEGEVRHVDGSCIVPKITRKVYVVSVPKQTPQPSDSLPDLPPPRVDHNILFVRLPEGGVGPDPIIVPPPRQDNIVYVLSKRNQNGQRVIEVPAPPPSEPEIYFVNYDDGENPTLPGGLDLETALGSAVEANGQVFTDDTGNNIVDAGFSSIGSIGNVAESGVGNLISVNAGVSGSVSHGSQNAGNAIPSSSSITVNTPSSISVSGSFQSGGVSQDSQGGLITPVNTYTPTPTQSSSFAAGNTGLQSGGVSQGSQFTGTTTGNIPLSVRPTPSGLYVTP